MIFLSYLSLAIPVFAALLFGLLAPILILLLYGRFAFGVAYISIAFLIDTLTFGDGGINVGISLYYADIFLALLAVVATLRLVFAADVPKKNWAWLAFCALVLVSLITGLITFGTGAGVQARSYFYFVAAGLYGMSFEMHEQRVQIALNALAAVAVFLMGLAVYRWIVYFTPITSLLPPSGSYNVDGAIRVIYSFGALAIAQTLVGSLFFADASRGFRTVRVLIPFLLGTVLALQHRSVWLATLLGVLTRFVIGNSKNGSKFRQALYVLVMVAITAVPLAFNENLAGVSRQIGSGASSALAGEGTAGERLQSWQEIIKNWYGAGLRSIAIGQSFGTDNSRYVKDNRGELKKIDYIAHNLYVQTLFNTGIFGLLAYFAANLYVVAGLYRMCQRAEGGAIAEVLLVLMVMQLAYYIPYGVDYLQSFMFGIALAYVATNQAANIPSTHNRALKPLNAPV